MSQAKVPASVDCIIVVTHVGHTAGNVQAEVCACCPHVAVMTALVGTPSHISLENKLEGKSSASRTLSLTLNTADQPRSRGRQEGKPCSMSTSTLGMRAIEETRLVWYDDQEAG